MSKPFIPFGWWPGHWGLRGKTRDRARAEYELEGRELEVRLAEIEHSDEVQLAIKLAQIDHTHKLLTDYEYELKLTELNHPEGTDRDLAQLELDHKHNKINNNDYEKRRAELLDEPWVNVIKLSWNPQDPTQSYFELDYNEQFIQFLRENGYTYTLETQVIESWLNDVCRSVANDMLMEGDSFVSDASMPSPVSRRPRRGRNTDTSD